MVKESLDPHPSDDTLELYALGRLTENSTDATEEHLLVCRNCQERFVDVDTFVLAMRQACRESIHSEKARTLWIFKMPTPIWAGAFALVLLGVSIPLVGNRRLPEAETEITLVASRGSEPAVKPATAIRLNIDAAGLPAFPAYTISIVRASGKEAWHTDIVPSNSRLNVRVPIKLQSGSYWVRVSAGGGDLREFPLAIQ